jgi:hypothetical protein
MNTAKYVFENFGKNVGATNVIDSLMNPEYTDNNDNNKNVSEEEEEREGYRPLEVTTTRIGAVRNPCYSTSYYYYHKNELIQVFTTRDLNDRRLGLNLTTNIYEKDIFGGLKYVGTWETIWQKCNPDKKTGGKRSRRRKTMKKKSKRKHSKKNRK